MSVSPINENDLIQGVTIVLNVYNAEQCIEDFLDSLADQTFKNFHLLVVDDGSTDNTIKKINNYKEKFDMTLYKRPHEGLRKARKFGVDKVKGDIILIFDADLILDKNAIQELISSLKTDNVGGVGGLLKSREGGVIAEAYGSLREFFINLKTKENKTDWINGGFCAYKTHILKAAGGLSSGTTSEDLDISWRIKNKKYLLLLNKKAIAYHLDPDSFSEVWMREKNIGFREYYLTRNHLKESLKIRRILRFYPFLLPFIIPIILFYYWPLLFIFLLFSYIGILIPLKGSFVCKTTSWIIFNVMNIAYCAGFFSAAIKRKKSA